ncbi:MAG TPA: Ldh family oxidoreductase [Burkholderiales bacterium]|jgi:ureidoglycolate dehydrogenase (NAD+)|nr:Ldh family oxidoreductase [Burkholderiales bacterium]
MRETRVPRERLEAFTAECLEKLGVQSADAKLVAQTLVAANLRGVDSHGVVRLPHYATRLRNGSVKAHPRISARRTGPSTAVIGGDAGMGQLVAARAMQEAISLARETGVGAAVARNSSHCGACAWFVEMAVKEGMIGVAITHTDSIMVPPGMKRIFLGSNPIAFGAPGEREPVIIDMSTTHVAWGKILVARQEGKSIPPDWGVDQDGKPTTDPHAVVGLAPTGSHKGYALAAMVEILCAQLAGVPFGRHVTKMYGELDKPRNLGHFMLALDVRRFTDAREFGKEIASFLKEIHDEGALAPGDPERRTAERRAREGIPIPENALAELNALAGELGVAKL